MELRFGPLAPSLAMQLAEQGFCCETVEEYEADRAALNKLRFRGAVTAGEARKIWKRMLVGIEKHSRSALRAEGDGE